MSKAMSGTPRTAYHTLFVFLVCICMGETTQQGAHRASFLKLRLLAWKRRRTAEFERRNPCAQLTALLPLFGVRGGSGQLIESDVASGWRSSFCQGFDAEDGFGDEQE